MTVGQELGPAPVIHGPTKGAVVLFIIAIVSSILFVVGSAAYVLITTGNQINSSCDFWHTLSTFPIAPVPPVKVPSKFGVTIVLDALKSYKGYCGTLKPTPSLVKWAGYYHLPLP